MPYMPGQIIIQSAANASAIDLETQLGNLGYSILGYNKYLGLYQLQIPAGTTMAQAESALKSQTGIQAVTRQWILRPGYTPSDPPYQNRTAGAAPGFRADSRPQVWSATPVAGPAIAVLDTGVDVTSPDLSAKVVSGADFIAPGGDGRTDTDGHAPYCRNHRGAGRQRGRYRRRVLGLQHHTHSRLPGRRVPVFRGHERHCQAVKQGAGVINISLEGTASPGDPAWNVFQNVIDFAASRGIFITAAAGNGGVDAANIIPAALNNVFAVGFGVHG